MARLVFPGAQALRAGDSWEGCVDIALRMGYNILPDMKQMQVLSPRLSWLSRTRDLLRKSGIESSKEVNCTSSLAPPTALA